MGNNMPQLSKKTIENIEKSKASSNNTEKCDRILDDSETVQNRNPHYIVSKNIYGKQLYLSDDILIEEELSNYRRSLTENSTNLYSQIGNQYINERSNNNYSSFPQYSLGLMQYKSFNSENTDLHSFNNEIILSMNNQAAFSISFQSNEENSNKASRKTKANLLRRSYISKLINYKAHLFKQSNFNNLIIFDWDDTLLCTSYITPNGLFDDEAVYNKKDKKYFASLESTVYKLFTKSIEMGLTYIITNSVPGWVEYTSQFFYPRIYKLLSQLTIVSSRAKYEPLYPNDAYKWKLKSFEDIKAIAYSKGINNILSFGDSFIELEASQAFASKYDDVYIKSIKLITHPNPVQLNKQLMFVTKNINSIVKTSRSLTIEIGIRNRTCIFQSINI